MTPQWGKRQACPFLLTTLFFLSACGTAVTTGAKGRPGSADGQASATFRVVSFSPASGQVAALPSTVTVVLSDVPNRALLGAVTHYNINCGGETETASSVDALTGFSSVTVTLPAVAGAEAGAQCTFAVSSNLQDLAGNRLGGARTVTYRISN